MPLEVFYWYQIKALFLFLLLKFICNQLLALRLRFEPIIWVGKFRTIWVWALFTAPMGPLKDQNGVYYYMVLLNNN